MDIRGSQKTVIAEFQSKGEMKCQTITEFQI